MITRSAKFCRPFSLRDNDRFVGVMSSSVGDLLYGSLPRYERAMHEILDTFSIWERNATPFRFCGKEVVQHNDDSVTATAKDNTKKIRPMNTGVKRRGMDKCTAEETACVRSVVAAMAWVTKQVRTGLTYRVSKLQSAASSGCVQDARS